MGHAGSRTLPSQTRSTRRTVRRGDGVDSPRGHGRFLRLCGIARTAGRLCPHAVFLEGHHSKYAEWSDRVAGILAKFSPIVELVSIDEAYLDLAGTERLHGPPLAATDKLLRQITRETLLPCSGGLAATRLVAKVASDQAKPRGLVWVPAGSEQRFLAK